MLRGLRSRTPTSVRPCIPSPLMIPFVRASAPRVPILVSTTALAAVSPYAPFPFPHHLILPSVLAPTSRVAPNFVSTFASTFVSPYIPLHLVVPSVLAPTFP